MKAPLVADDGLRNTHRFKHGTNKHYPCGHQRVPENSTVVRNRAPICRLCRRRIDRESKARRNAVAA